jgi:hypothetical protein
MVFRRIGLSRVEMEPLGAMVGSYEIRRDDSEEIKRYGRRQDALKDCGRD